ncbi:hypothetical protein ACFLSP_02880 [Bacteroidota bacterium]
MIAQPNGFSSIDMVQYINDVREMCDKHNYLGISSTLEISEESARLIKNIEAFYFIDVNRDGIGDHVDYNNRYNPEDTTKSIIKSRLLIRAEVLDNIVFNEVKQGLIRYINNNPYLITVNDLRKVELQELIDQSAHEINKLDSLQDFEYYKDLAGGKLNREGQIVFLNENMTQLYYLDKTALLLKQLDYKRSLALATDPITIIKDFTPLQAEENPLIEYLIKFSVIMAFLGYIFMMLIAYRKRIVEYLSEKA